MILIVLLLSSLFATLPLVSVLAFIWWMDRYEREPWWLVLLSLIWGGTGGVLFGVLGSMALNFPLELALDPTTAGALSTAFVAPLTEEPAKALVLLAIARSRHFDNITDGFVYGAAAGLGFGVSENLLYFMSVANADGLGAWAANIILRTLYSAMMHAGATSMVGAALGLAKLRSLWAGLLIAPTGLGLAMAMHALWNGLIVASGVFGAPALTVLNLLVFPLELAALLFVFQVSLWTERRMIRRELTEEAKLGTIPAEHVDRLSSALRRDRKGWLRRGIDHSAYVRAATTLAFRRVQAERARSPELTGEVERLRAELHRLLRVP
ncbi:PrsW family intramembrane metalloprotease [Myxococcota bacterium]|nr:PrsW family intramembrane metalloprotease [Myxococcota bacterium]